MNTKHLDQDALIGYLYRTIDDAQREAFDAHLAICPACRVRYEQQESLYRRINRDLSAALSQTGPSRRMTFGAISDRLGPHPPLRSFWRRLELSTPIALSVAGLLLSFLGMWQIIETGALLNPGQYWSAAPTLACFLFMLVSVDGFEKSFSIRPRFMVIVLVASLLWLGTAFIGLLNILVLRDLAIMAVVAFGGRAAEAGPVAIMAVMGATLGYIGVVIGGAEYHYKNIGQPGSWKLFSITLLIQLFILILPYLLL